MQEISVVSLIQAMLSPGIMISACGLLLLGMNNKYSLVVNRIRLLNEEKRKYMIKNEAGSFDYFNEQRLNSITEQLHRLYYRVGLVKNAVFSYSLAVAFFVLASLGIGVGAVTEVHTATTISMILFSAGMITVLVGVTFAALEVLKGYQIVEFELKVDE